MRIGFIALLPLLAAGCAEPPKAQTTDVAQAQQKSCVREYRVGSNIPVVNCSGPQTEAERQRMIDEVSNQVRPTANTRGGGGS